jgi:flagellar protein FlbD
LIKVKRLNGKEFVVNAELIEFVESTPDTVISMVSGRKVVVEERVDVIIAKIIDYYARRLGLSID